MEQDRYQQNSKLFIIGLICLLSSLSLFFFSLYIMPYLIWSWSYNVPGFIISLREWLKQSYNYTNSGASWLIISTFLIPAIICGWVSYRASNSIDNEIYGIKREKISIEYSEELKRDVQETFSFGSKLFLLIILVIVAVLVIQWVIAPPVPVE